MMIAIIILLLILAVVGWVSYFTSNSIYRSLAAKDNPNARAMRVLSFILMFVLLIGLLWLFVVTNLTFER